MKLNAFGDVCLRTLMLLGAEPDRQMTGREIADAVGIPYNHVSKAVLELKRRGALEVSRGRTGGARITPVGLGLSVGRLLRDLDTQPDIVDCTGSGSDGGRPCPLLAGCRLRSALARAREAFYAELDDTTVAELTGPAATPFPSGPTALPLPTVR
ncbi:Rrf2 family transcriptional regulator [Citricoccus sp. SGAir0253]|uniref:RrF2 family transcriptional regulator n=1 Tax=Citricoccus sp. SGAir0253 TaxID=2567881 RepID=UPI0010CD3169|nr:Rrf2 family transcriptional regulator [Citricoccus sp. SGAir0253]QCU78833.1 Rrf2 family transcriptional regulator [Citricoccus sp. SGAir0253]